MKELEEGSIESSELVEQTFNFWFSDNEHIRSPFPDYIRPVLKDNSIKGFYNWVSKLNPKAKEEVNDEIISEKFEEIIFENALKLVLTDDEKITIQYPFLPRLNDEISNSENMGEGKSIVIDRTLYKDGDHSFLKVVMEKISTKKLWETKFELPV